MSDNEFLKPGMIVGFYHPRSKWLRLGDMRKCKIPQKRKRPKFTHNSLYLGKDKYGRMVFVEHNLKYIRKTTLKRLRWGGFYPMVVVGANPRINWHKRNKNKDLSIKCCDRGE